MNNYVNDTCMQEIFKKKKKETQWQQPIKYALIWQFCKDSTQFMTEKYPQ